MTTFFIILGLLIALIGVMGTLLPVLPGVVFSYLALIVLSLAKDWQAFSPAFLLVCAGALALVMVLDYVFPLLSAKKYGASKWGMWGCVAGSILGIFFITPWGIIVGAFVGAFVGELISGKRGDKALRVGWGIFVGNLMSFGLKIIYAVTMLFFYVKALFQ